MVVGITDSLSKNEWVDETLYEVKGCITSTETICSQAPKKSRENLAQGVSIYVYSLYPNIRYNLSYSPTPNRSWGQVLKIPSTVTITPRANISNFYQNVVYCKPTNLNFCICE